MKVTVCFNNVRVVVPCGDGELMVSELIEKATMRYKKATGKSKGHYVNIHTLKIQKDGGILDADDMLSDVADDREQIVALFEESGHTSHNGGDGTSNSSMGTSSPDICQNGDSSNNTMYNFQSEQEKFLPMNCNDVIITPSDLSAPTSLKVLSVRRGSESNLTQIGTSSSHSCTDTENESSSQKEVPRPAPRINKHWSAMPSLDHDIRQSSGRNSPSQNSLKSNESDKPRPPTSVGADQDENSAFSRFARDSARQSLGSNHPALSKWLDTQDSTEYHDVRTDEDQFGRRDPLGGNHREITPLYSVVRKPNEPRYTEVVVEMKSVGGPLGIHVVPDIDRNGRDIGLLVQGVEPGGKIAQDGRISEQDKIIEINGKSLYGVNFTHAQDVFRRGLLTGEIRLRVIKNKAPPLPNVPPPTLPKPKPKGKAPKPPTQHPNTHNVTTPQSIISTNNDNEMTEISNPWSDFSNQLPDNNKQEELTPKKEAPAVPMRDPSTTLSNTGSLSRQEKYLTANTRKIGKKIHIQLTKGSQGLGFSVTTRDNQTGESNPIYIKNILPKGAAVSDGRLHSGDRLLEVNGIEMTGKPQSEVVQILRNTKLGSVVNLVVSRQEAVDSPLTLPRELPEKSDTEHVAPSDGDLAPVESAKEDEDEITDPKKEVLEFDIPLNDTGSAGLGVSVKGKTITTEQGTHDLGIFIKAIITGGAASKDCRLCVNDQLLTVNSESLLSKTNSEAMDTLRCAMQRNDISPGHIKIMVARQKGSIFQPVPGLFSSGASEIFNQNRLSVSSEGQGHSTDTMRSEGANSRRSDTTSSAADTESAKSTGTDNSLQTVIHLANNNQPRSEQQSQPAQQTGIQNNVVGVTSKSSPHPYFQGVIMRNSQSSYGSVGGSSVTINVPSEERVLIEDDQSPPQEHSVSTRNDRPQSALAPPTQPKPVLNSTSGPDEVFDPQAPQPPEWLVQWEKRNRSLSDSTDVTSPGPENDGQFSREGFGRQSISEKRRGHFKDPSESEVYQKAKQVKETKAIQKTAAKASKSFHGGTTTTTASEIGPSLGMKKSSSLESLQAMVSEVNKEKDPGSRNWNSPNSVVRGRGCNESFRAAVDRSYMNAEIENMETLEEEGSEKGSFNQRSLDRSSISSHDSDYKKKNRKSGIFKGLGNVFKFGKNRKPLEEKSPQSPAVDLHKKREDDRLRQEQLEKAKARQAQQEEQQRIQEQYRKLQEKQMQVEQQQQHHGYPPPRPEHLTHHHHNQHHGYPPLSAQQTGHHQDLNERHSLPTGLPQNIPRAERIQLLRIQHQQRHKERQGHYPLDEKEEQYEQQLKQIEKQLTGKSAGYGMSYGGENLELPSRNNRVPYERSSRKDEIQPQTYSHYQNYNEIKDQFEKRDYYQEKYQLYQQQLRQNKNSHHHRRTHSRDDLADNTGISEMKNRSASDNNIFHGANMEQHPNQPIYGQVIKKSKLAPKYNAANTSSQGHGSNVNGQGHNVSNQGQGSRSLSKSFDDYDDPCNAYTDRYSMLQRQFRSDEDIIMSNSAQV